MSIQVNPAGRLDLLLFNCLEHLCRVYIEPHATVPLWDNGLDKLAAYAIRKVGIPSGSVTHVYVGRLPVPIKVFEVGVRHMLGELQGVRRVGA